MSRAAHVDDGSEPPAGAFPTVRRVVGWRRWRTIACVVLAVVVVAGITDGVATVYYGNRVKARLVALKAAGKPLTGQDIAPAPVPAADNAAPLYMAAAEIIKAHDESSGNAPYDQPADVPREEVGYSRYNWTDPEDLAVLGAYVREDHRALELLRDATGRPSAVFDVDWSQGFGTLLTHYAKLRNSGRFLAASAIVATHEGDQAEAMDRVRMGFVTARHTSGDPALVGQLVAAAIDAVTRRAAGYVLAQGRVPVDSARRLSEELGRIDYPQGYVRSMQGERVCGLDAFTRVRRGDLKILGLVGEAEVSDSCLERMFLWAYPSLLRPVLYADELRYLDCLDQSEARASLTPRKRGTPREADGSGASAPGWAVLTRLLAPAFPRAELKFDCAVAQRRLLQAALGLQVHRQQHGRYPADLAELRGMGWTVPVDNFSEEDFIYRRTGSGYLLYSVGPDLQDSGGRPHWLQLPRKPGPQDPSAVDATGDVVWPEPGDPLPWGFSE